MNREEFEEKFACLSWKPLRHQRRKTKRGKKMNINLTNEDIRLIQMCIETELNIMDTEDKLKYGKELNRVVKKLSEVRKWIKTLKLAQ